MGYAKIIDRARNRYCLALVDIHAGLRGTAAYLDALQCVPVVIVDGRTIDRIDAYGQVLQIDDVRLPRRADVGIADVQLRVIDVDDFAVDAGAQHHGLSGAVATDDEVVEAVVAGAGGTAALVADESGHLSRVHLGRAVHEPDGHRHVARIEPQGNGSESPPCGLRGGFVCSTGILGRLRRIDERRRVLGVA